MSVTGAEGLRPDPFIEFTNDRHAAELLRLNLRGIANQHPTDSMGRLIREVLSGGRGIRDLQRDPEFMDLMCEGVEVYRDYMTTLSPEERADLLARAHELVADDE
ncbi:hypothetical protein [Nocardioides campestrisoli]|uniref:hypothetical protein n=1 Tax=Nocardioides campestrisoli TaxID=2736757 RepID=UPI00163D9A09|nr:hypothetical protein [Nocardioides campestrisoli]